MPVSNRERQLSQVRLLLEEVCCDLCRFHHVVKDGHPPEAVRIDREFHMGTPGAFADIRVEVPGGSAYFVEVKFGYSADTLCRHLRRKYGPETAAATFGSKVIVVVERGRTDWNALEAGIQQSIASDIELEIWDEPRLLARMRDLFEAELPTITVENLVDLRQAIDRAKGRIAFGSDPTGEYEHDPLKAQLLWHFGFWRVRQLREKNGFTPRQMLTPGMYTNVVVLLADLCSFSSYVRDTSDSEVIRDSLTSFYSKARYQIINNGGILYQFVGDEVIGLFGIPDQDDDYLAKAVATARALTSIGASVSHDWQRRIDRVQTSGGLHIGMAVGDLQIVSLRPFSRTHVGALGDCINVAARLMGNAGPGEIVVTNSFYQRAPIELQREFLPNEPIEAKNVGRLKVWRLPATLDAS